MHGATDIGRPVASGYEMHQRRGNFVVVGRIRSRWRKRIRRPRGLKLTFGAPPIGGLRRLKLTNAATAPPHEIARIAPRPPPKRRRPTRCTNVCTTRNGAPELCVRFGTCSSSEALSPNCGRTPHAARALPRRACRTRTFAEPARQECDGQSDEPHHRNEHARSTSPHIRRARTGETRPPTRRARTAGTNPLRLSVVPTRLST